MMMPGSESTKSAQQMLVMEEPYDRNFRNSAQCLNVGLGAAVSGHTASWRILKLLNLHLPRGIQVRKKIPALGPKVHRYCLPWAIWIPSVWRPSSCAWELAKIAALKAGKVNTRTHITI